MSEELPNAVAAANRLCRLSGKKKKKKKKQRLCLCVLLQQRASGSRKHPWCLVMGGWFLRRRCRDSGLAISVISDAEDKWFLCLYSDLFSRLSEKKQTYIITQYKEPEMKQPLTERSNCLLCCWMNEICGWKTECYKKKNVLAKTLGEVDQSTHWLGSLKMCPLSHSLIHNHGLMTFH